MMENMLCDYAACDVSDTRAAEAWRAARTEKVYTIPTKRQLLDMQEEDDLYDE